MVPTREIYWNIPALGVVLMYLVALVAVGIMGYGIWRRGRLWRRGRPVSRLRPVGPRLRAVLRHVFAHGRLLADRVAGASHLAFFWGFLFLFAGTTVVFIHQDLKIRIMQGAFYLYFQSAALDVMGLAAAAGVACALAMRYLVRSPRLRRGVLSDAVILWLFELILVTGFVVEGLRIAGTRDPWGAWSPVGYAVAGMVRAAALSEGAIRLAHAGFWWGHFLLSMAFVAYIPYSKLFHLVLAPVNTYLQPLQNPAGVGLIDFERTERFGASAFSDLTWKDLFDLDVCTECGRCTAVCPAALTGKVLSPMHVVLDLRDEMHRTDGASSRALGGQVVAPEALWACVTCMACMEACPVFIEHVPKIVEMRRHLVMEEASLPETMGEALRSLEARGHPFRGAGLARTAWIAGVEVKDLSKGDRAEWLLWVGCAAALNERNHAPLRALVRVLQAAGLDVGILGDEEGCSGDPARRIGNEYLFCDLARRTIETLDRRGVAKIVTLCPHCYNTFRHEYPDLGGHYEVWHHTQLLAHLIDEGRLRPTVPVAAAVTFHDPCYLGRHNGEYEAPRRVLRAIPGARAVEMAQCREKGFCCGAGGGLYWVEDRVGQRINHVRARHAAATGAEVVATACPFCLLMLEDGAAALESSTRPMDVVEVLERSVGKAPH
ncbi:MAG: (Fe-S)-binding protein [Armatimonadota bacterium]|nr:(Fe-S)-binding protein [Armatimonadota bacterium]MDR7520528.1 (Fe-S)-binding protein [Armatimonadota bacterium]MDR7549859.1 (Fe-S)-binding protein [Armatimonadota bacterium]